MGTVHHTKGGFPLVRLATGKRKRKRGKNNILFSVRETATRSKIALRFNWLLKTIIVLAKIMLFDWLPRLLVDLAEIQLNFFLRPNGQTNFNMRKQNYQTEHAHDGNPPLV